jgi:citrate synthase
MLDGAAAADSIERYIGDLLDAGDRLMGFGHRVYRAEDPRARLLRGTAMDLGSPRFQVAEELERVVLAELHARKPDRVLATNVEFWSAVVLDVADIPPKLAPAMFACSRTAGWSAHIMEQKRLGRLVRPAARYVGPGPRSLPTS